MNWDSERDNHFTRTVAEAVARMGLTSVREARTIDCHGAWLAAGKTRQGEFCEAKLHHYAKFCYAARRVDRAARLHQARSLYTAAMDGDIKLMKAMRQVKSGKRKMDDLAETLDSLLMLL